VLSTLHFLKHYRIQPIILTGSLTSYTQGNLFKVFLPYYRRRLFNSDGNLNFFTDNFAPNLDTIIGSTYSLPDQSFSYISEVRSPTTEGPTVSSPAGLEIVWPNWPVNLPRPDLLRYL